MRSNCIDKDGREGQLFIENLDFSCKPQWSFNSYWNLWQVGMQDLDLHEYHSDPEHHSLCCSTAEPPEIRSSSFSHSSLSPGGFISGATVAG